MPDASLVRMWRVMMARHFRRLGPGGWLVSGTFMWLAVMAVVQARPSAGAPPAAAGVRLARMTPSPQEPSAANSPTYIGEEACLTCHSEQGESYAKSAHHRAMDPRTPAAARACETCHGPGSRHATSGDPATVAMRNPAKLPAEQTNALCTTCHNKGEHALWEGSQHEVRGLSCVSCHSQHESKSETALLKGRTQMETCAVCHRDKVAKLDRSGHMPLREGKMECTSCHTPHGSTNVRLLRKGDSVAEMCTSCHAEKRGPFLWEHAPARDGCATCHDPHGSANERMLVARPPILCQRCHVARQHPSTIYDAGAVQTSIRVYARSCVTCHTNIHGSNHPNGERFIR